MIETSFYVCDQFVKDTVPVSHPLSMFNYVYIEANASLSSVGQFLIHEPLLFVVELHLQTGRRHKKEVYFI